MRKIWASVKKEVLLLVRDFGALVIVFVMPLALIITVTLIQNDSFNNLSPQEVPLLLVDNDKGSVAEGIVKNLGESGFFKVDTQDGLTEQEVKDQVFKGSYQLAIVIPKELSTDLYKKVEGNVGKILADVGMEHEVSQAPVQVKPKEIKLYFDPATQLSFKSAVMGNIGKMVSELESQAIYSSFQEQLSDSVALFTQEPFISFQEVLPVVGNKQVLPNATQHNVPAWTLFAIFFIVVPLSINLVKEKTQGTQVRLRTLPMRYFTVITGKTLTFLLICMIQFYLMLAVGKFLFPLMGLQTLNIGGNLVLMTVIALFCGLAAIGLGILLGTIASTQEQSAPFGATFVVILAAIGGVWVPVFMMPGFMQVVSKLSPMNWGLEAFYHVLLRNAGLVDVLPQLFLLLGFFVISIVISVVYDQKKRAA